MIALTPPPAKGILHGDEPAATLRRNDHPELSHRAAEWNAVIAGHQETTREWWATCHERFALHVSQFVLDEAGSGDPEAARLRLEVLRGLPELPATESALALAIALLIEGAVPERARTDAAHISVAAVHGMDFLVTWNCRHIANAEKESHIREVCLHHGWRPVICTPEQLLSKEEGETS